jgi:hypothetical protein
MTVRQARRAESVFIALGQLDRDTAKINHGEFLTNKALMTYYSSYKFFSVSFSCKSKNPADRIPIRINHIRDTIRPSGTITINIFNTHPREKSSNFTIEADQLDLKSIRVSDFVNLEEKIVYL